VITEDEVMRLLERADPARRVVAAPAVDAAGYLAALRTGSSTVTIIETETTPIRPPHRRRWPIIVAAAAVVAIVVGGVVLATRDDDPSGLSPADAPVAPTADPDAIEVAMGFLDAYGDFDADRVLSYVSADAISDPQQQAVSFLAGSSPEEFRHELAIYEAFRHRQTITGCEQIGVSPAGTTVRCTYDRHEFGSDAVGLGPYTGNYWDLTIRDGKITATVSEWNIDDGSSAERWGPFSRWVVANYPDDVPVIYPTGINNAIANTEEAAALLTQRVDEFVAEELDRVEIAGTFMDAWTAGDGEAAADLFAADGHWEDVDAGELPAVLGWVRAVGADYHGDGCTRGRTTTDVTCDYSVENDLTRFLGVGPIANYFVVKVADGAISEVNDVPNDQLAQLWSSFAAWVADNHPDDVERMFVADTTTPRLDATAIDLWDRYVGEFTATETG